jgi:hypothetical protein
MKIGRYPNWAKQVYGLYKLGDATAASKDVDVSVITRDIAKTGGQ